MRRSILAFDRVIVLLLGLVLIVLGVAAVGWQTGFLGSVWPAVPDQITVDSTQVTTAVQPALRQELQRLGAQELAHVSVAVREVVRASASARPVARVR